ncbi:MAG: amidohydrolase family protein [Burkholderiaceae bacterium]
MSDHDCRHHGAIDLHTHVVPAQFPAYAGRHQGVAWPSMKYSSACEADIIIGGRGFRALDDRSWEVSRRLDAMDAAGIDRQVLSPMPELLSYWFPPEDAEVFADHVNGMIADMIAQAPQRFTGLGMVPLQDLERAIRCLETLVRERGFAGVEIGSHIAGTPIGDPSLDPFFEAAESLSAAVFVHALHPIGRERLVGPAMLAAALLFPCDVGLAAASTITGGLLERRPRLRLAFSHGGGAFGLLLPRLAHVWASAPEIQASIARDPRELARRLWFDSLVYDRDTLAFLIGKFGIDRLILGSDFPFQIHDPDPVGRIDALGLEPADAHRLAHANAVAFLGLDSGG